MHEVEKDRKEAYGGHHLPGRSRCAAPKSSSRLETKNLVTALRRPQTRGRWGELHLRKVVEMAGMAEHCDFDEQLSVRTGDDPLQRPDLVVHLPDGAEVVVDSKVPLSAYLDAIEAPDEEDPHARAAHAREPGPLPRPELSSKEYWRQFERSPDFVVCFVPGDALLSAAFEADPTLTEFALSNHVLLTGPTALIALLQTVSYGWRQERLARHTAEIQQLAERLYERLGKFAGHLSKLRGSLDKAVGSYNDAVSSPRAPPAADGATAPGSRGGRCRRRPGAPRAHHVPAHGRPPARPSSRSSTRSSRTDRTNGSRHAVAARVRFAPQAGPTLGSGPRPRRYSCGSSCWGVTGIWGGRRRCTCRAGATRWAWSTTSAAAQYDYEMGVDSPRPHRPAPAPGAALEGGLGAQLDAFVGDLTDHRFVETRLEPFAPDAVVHFAEQRWPRTP